MPGEIDAISINITAQADDLKQAISAARQKLNEFKRDAASGKVQVKIAADVDDKALDQAIEKIKKQLQPLTAGEGLEIPVSPSFKFSSSAVRTFKRDLRKQLWGAGSDNIEPVTVPIKPGRVNGGIARKAIKDSIGPVTVDLNWRWVDKDVQAAIARSIGIVDVGLKWHWEGEPPRGGAGGASGGGPGPSGGGSGGGSGPRRSPSAPKGGGGAAAAGTVSGGRASSGGGNRQTYPCPECSAFYYNEDRLQDHVESKHRQEERATGGSLSGRKAPRKTSSGKRKAAGHDEETPCPVCGKLYASEGQMKSHQRSHAATSAPVMPPVASDQGAVPDAAPRRERPPYTNTERRFAAARLRHVGLSEEDVEREFAADPKMVRRVVRIVTGKSRLGAQAPAAGEAAGVAMSRSRQGAHYGDSEFGPKGVVGEEDFAADRKLSHALGVVKIGDRIKFRPTSPLQKETKRSLYETLTDLPYSMSTHPNLLTGTVLAPEDQRTMRGDESRRYGDLGVKLHMIPGYSRPIYGDASKMKSPIGLASKYEMIAGRFNPSAARLGTPLDTISAKGLSEHATSFEDSLNARIRELLQAPGEQSKGAHRAADELQKVVDASQTGDVGDLPDHLALMAQLQRSLTARDTTSADRIIGGDRNAPEGSRERLGLVQALRNVPGLKGALSQSRKQGGVRNPYADQIVGAFEGQQSQLAMLKTISKQQGQAEDAGIRAREKSTLDKQIKAAMSGGGNIDAVAAQFGVVPEYITRLLAPKKRGEKNANPKPVTPLFDTAPLDADNALAEALATARGTSVFAALEAVQASGQIRRKRKKLGLPTIEEHAEGGRTGPADPDEWNRLQPLVKRAYDRSIRRGQHENTLLDEGFGPTTPERRTAGNLFNEADSLVDRLKERSNKAFRGYAEGGKTGDAFDHYVGRISHFEDIVDAAADPFIRLKELKAKQFDALQPDATRGLPTQRLKGSATKASQLLNRALFAEQNYTHEEADAGIEAELSLLPKVMQEQGYGTVASHRRLRNYGPLNRHALDSEAYSRAHESTSPFWHTDMADHTDLDLHDRLTTPDSMWGPLQPHETDEYRGEKMDFSQNAEGGKTSPRKERMDRLFGDQPGMWFNKATGSYSYAHERETQEEYEARQTREANDAHAGWYRRTKGDVPPFDSNNPGGPRQWGSASEGHGGGGPAMCPCGHDRAKHAMFGSFSACDACSCPKFGGGATTGAQGGGGADDRIAKLQRMATQTTQSPHEAEIARRLLRKKGIPGYAEGGLDQLQRLFPNAKINLRGVHPEHIEQMVNVAQKLAGHYPLTAALLSKIGTDEGEDNPHNVVAYTKGSIDRPVNWPGLVVRSGITFGQKTDWNDPKARAEDIRWMEIMAHAPKGAGGVGMAGYAFGHEYGHAVSNTHNRLPDFFMEQHPNIRPVSDYGWKYGPKENWAEHFAKSQLIPANLSARNYDVEKLLSRIQTGEHDFLGKNGIPKFPKFADGGYVKHGGLLERMSQAGHAPSVRMVGERGPELQVTDPNTGETEIVPTHKVPTWLARARAGQGFAKDLTHHAEGGIDPTGAAGADLGLTCPRCFRKFGSIRMLNNHLTGFHKEDRRVTRNEIRARHRALAAPTAAPAPATQAAEPLTSVDPKGGPASGGAGVLPPATGLGRGSAGGPVPVHVVNFSDLKGSTAMASEGLKFGSLEELFKTVPGAKKIMNEDGSKVTPAQRRRALKQGASAEVVAAQAVPSEAFGDFDKRLGQVQSGIAEAFQLSPVRALSTSLGQISANVLGGRQGIIERAGEARKSYGLANRALQGLGKTEDEIAELEVHRRVAQKHGDEAGVKAIDEQVRGLKDELDVRKDLTKSAVAKAEADQKKIVGKGDITRNLAAGAVGVVTGTLAFSAALGAAQDAIQLVQGELGKATDRGTGFISMTNDMTKALGANIREMKGQATAAVAAAQAQTGMGAATAESIAPLLKERAIIEGGNKALGEQYDLINVANQLREQERTSATGGSTGAFQPSGGIPGITRSTGGFLNTPIGATPSIFEQISQQAGTSGGQEFVRGLVGTLAGHDPIAGTLGSGIVGALGANQVKTPAEIQAMNPAVATGDYLSPTNGQTGHVPTSPPSTGNPLTDLGRGFEFWNKTLTNDHSPASWENQTPVAATPPPTPTVDALVGSWGDLNDEQKTALTQTQAFTGSIQDLAENAKKGGSAVNFLSKGEAGYTDEVQKQSDAFLAQQGVSKDTIDALHKFGYAIADLKDPARKLGREDLKNFGTAAEIGATTPSPQLLVQQMTERVIPAMVADIRRRGQFERDFTQPATFALDRVANPRLSYAEDPRLGATKNILGGTVAGQFSKDQSAASGFAKKYASEVGQAQEIINAQFLKGRKILDGILPPKLMSDLSFVGKEIQTIQKDITQKQTNLQVAEYTNSIRVATRSLKDARDMWSAIKGQVKDTYGGLEGQNFQLGRQLQLLQFAQAQRQINFQKATAGFMSEGLTPDEIAARQDQAAYEAKIQQKQLNLSEKVAGNQYEQGIIAAKRNITDLETQLKLLQEGRSVTQDTAAASVALEKLDEARNVLLGQAQSLLQEQIGIETGLLDVIKNVETEAGLLTADLQKQVVQSFQTAATSAITDYIDPLFKYIDGHKTAYANSTNGNIGSSGAKAAGHIGTYKSPTRMTVGEAGSETVAILRNPREAMFSPTPSGGGGAMTVNVNFGNVSVRSHDDIDELVRKVEQALDRKAALLGLRAPLGS